MSEVPHLRWFENTERKCGKCGKRATGILRGSANESYGHYCEPCAMKRLADSKRQRERLTQAEKVKG